MKADAPRVRPETARPAGHGRRARGNPERARKNRGAGYDAARGRMDPAPRATRSRVDRRRRELHTG
eukprot:2137346-Prymnesium_polylepis.1